MKHVIHPSSSFHLVSPLACSSLRHRPLQGRHQLPRLATILGAPHSSRGLSVVCAAQPDSSRKCAKREKQPLTELRNIPGVGKVNESKLIEKGYDSLESLKELFIKDCNNNQEEAVKILKGTVGIRQKRHCESIVGHLRALLARPPLTVCVEGNISAGKSTFLKIVQGNNERLLQQLEVVPEPVDRWQTAPVFGSNEQRNLLDEYYKNPSKTAYVFQTYVFLTRALQEADSRSTSKRFRLMERSVFSDRMVFVKKLEADKLLNETQVAVYDGMFAPLVEGMPDLVPDGFIYLRAEPKTCMRRMQKRSRSEEVGVPEAYLQGLHNYHEQWLCEKDGEGQRQEAERAQQAMQSWMAEPGRHLTVNPLSRGSTGGRMELQGLSEGASDGPFNRPAFPDCLKGCIKWVYAAPHPLVDRKLGQVPVLILEMDQDLDLDRDVAAKQELGAKVVAYFDYMQQYRDSPQLYIPTPEEARRFKANMRNPDLDMSQQMLREGGYQSGPQMARGEAQLLEAMQRRQEEPKVRPLPEAMEELVKELPRDDLKTLYHLLANTDKYRGQGFGGLLNLSSALEKSATKAFLTLPESDRQAAAVGACR